MSEREITLIDGGRVTRVPARIQGKRVRIAPADLERGFGWELKPQGLCKGDLCVTLRERRGLLDEDGIDLAVFAQTAGLPLALDAREGVAVLGESAASRLAARLAGGARLHAPRSRGNAPLALAAPRQEGAADRLRLLVRLPRGPAGLAGTVRRARLARLRSDHGRARPLR